MACLERSVCRSLKLVSSPAKPILAKGPAGPRFPIKFKLINGESRIAKRNASKPEILKREGNVMFVSFSQQKETKEVPNSSVLQPTPELHKPPTLQEESKPVFSTETKEKTRTGRAGADIRQSAASSSSTQKGLQNLKRGKYDQLWMVKWLDWYKFLIAMTRKTWNVFVKTKFLSETVRAETAKMAWSS